MFFIAVVCVIGIFLGILTMLLGTFVNLEFDDTGSKGIGLSMILVGCIIFISSLQGCPKTEKPLEMSETEKICIANSLSYILVETVHEATKVPEEDIITIFKYTSKSGMEIYDAISLIDNTLTEEEVTAIVVISDMRQADADEKSETEN